MIAIDESDAAEDLEIPDRCRVLKLANTTTYDRMEKTIKLLQRAAVPDSSSDSGKGPQIHTPLMRVLLGMSPPSERIPVKDIKFFDSSLNPSQQEAVRFAMESPEVACIHGPPGTGKTHTLIEIIRQLTSQSEANPKPLRLLICGASNLAVDNILERLLALPPPENGTKLKVTRLGHPARVMAKDNVLEATLGVQASRSDQAALVKDIKNELDTALATLYGKAKGAKGKGPRGAQRKGLWQEVRALRKEYRDREGRVVEGVMTSSEVVLATCHSSGGFQLRQQIFDVVIIDEATQALEASCWIPIFKAKKLILAGDPMQLPPTIISDDKRSKKAAKANGPSQKPVSSVTKSGTKTIKTTAPTTNEDSEESEAGGSESEGDLAMDDIADEKVVPPVVKKDAVKSQAGKRLLRPPHSLETTLFDRLERMYGPGIKRMLNVQYRMHAQIASFPSKVMYRGKLTSHESVASHLLKDLPNVKAESPEEETEVLGTPVVFYDTAGCEYFERTQDEGEGDEGSKCNENEVSVVKGWVDRLISAGVLSSQIAVITPYQAQVSLLSNVIRPLYGLDIEIGTVDGMQGREKDAVIISLVRSNEKREVGFLKDKRRLNVAMTRAKRHLCVVGDSSTVQHGSPFLKRWMGWLEKNADVRYAGLE